MENDVYIWELAWWETAKICGKWRRSVGNGSNIGNDLIIWQTAKNDLEIWEMFEKRLKYLRKGLTMLEMA